MGVGGGGRMKYILFCYGHDGAAYYCFHCLNLLW